MEIYIDTVGTKNGQKVERCMLATKRGFIVIPTFIGWLWLKFKKM